MHVDLTGRTALVTGSTQGIGAAIATALARSGATVAVNGRTPDGVTAAVKRLRAEVPDAEVVPVAADVATEEGARLAVELLWTSSSTTWASSSPGRPWRSRTRSGGGTSK
jgi:NAD(P)-dependent dehydrogenase (short-subunit alcohol dehydrogenase family)